MLCGMGAAEASGRPCSAAVPELVSHLTSAPQACKDPVAPRRTCLAGAQSAEAAAADQVRVRAPVLVLYFSHIRSYDSSLLWRTHAPPTMVCNRAAASVKPLSAGAWESRGSAVDAQSGALRGAARLRPSDVGKHELEASSSHTETSCFARRSPRPPPARGTSDLVELAVVPLVARATLSDAPQSLALHCSRSCLSPSPAHTCMSVRSPPRCRR